MYDYELAWVQCVVRQSATSGLS